MVCVYCRSQTRVINSRRQKNNNHVWRRRICSNCSALFTTLEKPLFDQVLRIQDGDNLFAFEPYKLFISIYDSCKHRPGAVQEAKFLTETVIAKLLPQVLRASLDKKTVLGTVSEVLKRFDKAAYVHYQAYHPSV